MVVAVSDWVKAQAVAHLHLVPKNTHRIYNGVKAPPTGDGSLQARSAAPYILCVGSLQPHKNLRRIVAAFGLVAAEQPQLELWVVGRKQPRFRDSEDATIPSHPKIKLLGYVSEQELFEAYAGAAVFCYPSIEEGFGLPILEAMQAGAPVVTSNASCLPEIAGDAAELVDPFSIPSIAAGIKKLLALSSTERARVIAAGKQRASRFSWELAAKSYLELYDELIGTTK